MKACFTSSSGGHYEQLLMLQDLFTQFDSFIVTEATQYNQNDTLIPTYYLKQVNRKNFLFIFPLLYNVVRSFYIISKERPTLIISTGVLSTIPLCLLGKLFGSKVIYIESYAKVYTASLTAKLMYRVADIFFVQWPELLTIFPKAKYIGGIY